MVSVRELGVGEDLGLPVDRVPEARFCQRCGNELSYAYRSYAQLGSFRCPSCGFARPALDYVATGARVGHVGVAFDVGCEESEPWQVQADFSGVYLAYNLLAAVSVALRASVRPVEFQRALDGYDPGNGRLQRFVVGGRPVVLNLAKNPTGLNQNISLMLADERPNQEPRGGRLAHRSRARALLWNGRTRAA